MDTEAESLDDLYLNPNADFKTAEIEIEGRKIQALETEQYCLDRSGFDREALYQTMNYRGMTKKPVRFIPYFAWDNREFDEMRIWFPVAYPVQ
jgi:hypothetical protein